MLFRSNFHQAYAQLAINNIFNKRPPVDGGAGWPYYNNFNYNAYGRSVFLEIGMHFGEGKSASGLVDGVAAGHYREHAEQIRQWRQR